MPSVQFSSAFAHIFVALMYPTFLLHAQQFVIPANKNRWTLFDSSALLIIAVALASSGAPTSWRGRKANLIFPPPRFSSTRINKSQNWRNIVNNANQQAEANDTIIALHKAQEEETYLCKKAKQTAEEKKVTAKSKTNHNPHKKKQSKAQKTERKA